MQRSLQDRTVAVVPSRTYSGRGSEPDSLEGKWTSLGVAQLSETSGNGVAVDTRRVVHETIDGEVILIQLETGFYYSLDGVGAEIWALLGEDAAPADIASRLCERHGTNPTATTALVNQLLRELCNESLLL